ncbi:unnamed protein product [Boreogadus saida]
MQMRRREAGQGGGWGCGPEQLAATTRCRLPASGCRAVVLCDGGASRSGQRGPNSFSTMAEITPTTVSLWKYITEPTYYAP